MAKLPTIDALGPAPVPRAQTSVVSIDGTAPGRAQYAAAAEIANAGEALTRIDAEITRARRATELADAFTGAAGELGTAELEFANDQDFKTVRQRFDERAKAIETKYSTGITDNLVRQTFLNKYRERTLGRQLEVAKKAVAQERDHNTAQLDAQEGAVAQAAASARNPLERDTALDQYRLTVEGARMAGWITDVDAGKRLRGLQGRIDQAVALRDMQANPGATADRLATDPAYLANMDPVRREQLIDQSYRRAEADRAREESALKEGWRLRGEELMKENWQLLETGRLTSTKIERDRPYLSAGEYHSLIRGVREKKEGAAAKNDESAVASVYRALYVDNDPARAEQLAFQYQRNGLMKSTTLGTVLGVARSQLRQEGPRTEYERSKQHIANLLDAGQLSGDPAPRARMGVALRELDDFVATGPNGKRSDDEIRKKTDEVVKRYQIIDMNELVTRTGQGYRNDPQATIDRVAGEGLRLQRELDGKRITRPEFDKRMRQLNDTRRAAETALQGAGSGRK